MKNRGAGRVPESPGPGQCCGAPAGGTFPRWGGGGVSVVFTPSFSQEAPDAPWLHVTGWRAGCPPGLLVNYSFNSGAREGRGGATPAPGGCIGCGDRPAGAIRGAGGGHGNKGRRGREPRREGWQRPLVVRRGSPACPALPLSRSPGGEDRSAAEPGPGCAGGIANEVRELHQKGECGGGATGWAPGTAPEGCGQPVELPVPPQPAGLWRPGLPGEAERPWAPRSPASPRPERSAVPVFPSAERP